MDNYYGIHQNRTNRNILCPEASLLSECDDQYISQLDRKTILHYFCNDLRKILENDDLQKMIRELNQLDQLLVHLREEDINSDAPNLDEFFRILSPVLLRSIDESLNTLSINKESEAQEEGENSLLKGWLESIRIAIEEEIHIWQEKIL